MLTIMARKGKLLTYQWDKLAMANRRSSRPLDPPGSPPPLTSDTRPDRGGFTHLYHWGSHHSLPGSGTTLPSLNTMARHGSCTVFPLPTQRLHKTMVSGPIWQQFRQLSYRLK